MMALFIGVERLFLNLYQNGLVLVAGLQDGDLGGRSVGTPDNSVGDKVHVDSEAKHVERCRHRAGLTAACSAGLAHLQVASGG
jgi:hypothetical protein